MGKKLYVGNLPFTMDEAQLGEMFSQVGQVESLRLIIDRDTGRSKGFCFVEMATDEEALVAIEKLNGQPMGGRTLVVNEAKPVERRDDRGFGGGGGGGRGGGGGGGGRGGYGGGGGGGGYGGGGGGGGGGRGGRGGGGYGDR